MTSLQKERTEFDAPLPKTRRSSYSNVSEMQPHSRSRRASTGNGKFCSFVARRRSSGGNRKTISISPTVKPRKSLVANEFKNRSSKTSGTLKELRSTRQSLRKSNSYLERRNSGGYNDNDDNNNNYNNSKSRRRSSASGNIGRYKNGDCHGIIINNYDIFSKNDCQHQSGEERRRIEIQEKNVLPKYPIQQRHNKDLDYNGKKTNRRKSSSRKNLNNDNRPRTKKVASGVPKKKIPSTRAKSSNFPIRDSNNDESISPYNRKNKNGTERHDVSAKIQHNKMPKCKPKKPKESSAPRRKSTESRQPPLVSALSVRSQGLALLEQILTSPRKKSSGMIGRIKHFESSSLDDSTMPSLCSNDSSQHSLSIGGSMHSLSSDISSPTHSSMPSAFEYYSISDSMPILCTNVSSHNSSIRNRSLSRSDSLPSLCSYASFFDSRIRSRSISRNDSLPSLCTIVSSSYYSSMPSLSDIQSLASMSRHDGDDLSISSLYSTSTKDHLSLPSMRELNLRSSPRHSNLKSTAGGRGVGENDGIYNNRTNSSMMQYPYLKGKGTSMSDGSEEDTASFDGDKVDANFDKDKNCEETVEYNDDDDKDKNYCDDDDKNYSNDYNDKNNYYSDDCGDDNNRYSDDDDDDGYSDDEDNDDYNNNHHHYSVDDEDHENDIVENQDINRSKIHHGIVEKSTDNEHIQEVYQGYTNNQFPIEGNDCIANNHSTSVSHFQNHRKEEKITNPSWASFNTCLEKEQVTTPFDTTWSSSMKKEAATDISFSEPAIEKEDDYSLGFSAAFISKDENCEDNNSEMFFGKSSPKKEGITPISIAQNEDCSKDTTLWDHGTTHNEAFNSQENEFGTSFLNPESAFDPLNPRPSNAESTACSDKKDTTTIGSADDFLSYGKIKSFHKLEEVDKRKIPDRHKLRKEKAPKKSLTKQVKNAFSQLKKSNYIVGGSLLASSNNNLRNKRSYLDTERLGRKEGQFFPHDSEDSEEDDDLLFGGISSG